MRKTLRLGCLLAAVVYTIAAHAPCPPVAMSDHAVSDEHAAHTAMAAPQDAHADCHGAAPPALSAPCPCGCGDRPAAAPGTARLGTALLAALKTPPPIPTSVAATVPHAVRLHVAPTFDLDPVPI